jgi:hypothetical protein
MTERRKSLRAKALRELRRAAADLTPPIVRRALQGKDENALKNAEARERLYEWRVPLDLGTIDRFEYGGAPPVFRLPVEKARYEGGVSYLNDDQWMRIYYRKGKDALANYYSQHQLRDLFEKTFLPFRGSQFLHKSLPWTLDRPAEGWPKRSGEMGLSLREPRGGGGWR